MCRERMPAVRSPRLASSPTAKSATLKVGVLLALPPQAELAKGLHIRRSLIHISNNGRVSPRITFLHVALSPLFAY